jgi:starch-binding outer membrane protein, SusD/RagB family
LSKRLKQSKMKKFAKYSLLLALIVGFFACDQELQLEPEQSLSPEVTFSNEGGAQAALFGAYSAAQDLEVFGGMMFAIGDYMSDNVNFVGSFPTLQEINNYVTIASNGSVQTIFADNYYCIMASNAVIDNVPKVVDVNFTDAERAQTIAEAKFLRAAVYLQLVNFFGQPIQVNSGNTPGVPLVLTAGALIGDIVKPARNTVAEVYAQIEKDLNEALPALPASYPAAANTRGRATKGAVNGLLSRIALYKGEWAKVITAADAILVGNSLYALATDYAFYDNNTSEDIFTVQMTATDNSRTGTGGLGGYFLPATRGGRGDAPISANLLAAFTAGDRRLTTLSFTGTAANNAASTFTNKYRDGATNADNAPYMRVTEMVLNKAEALVRSTNTVNADAITLMNRLRTRAGLPAFEAAQFADANAFLTAILNERRLELCFEGHRRMDLLRNGLPLRTAGAGAGISKPGDPRILLPIPTREIDLGSALPQNAGY